jgi:hypothetical protein
VVDEAVAHARGGAPRNLGHGCPALGADALGGLADDLDELGQREPEQFVVIKVMALLILAEVDGLAAASWRCRSRTWSSGRIEGAGVGGDLVAEVRAEILGRAELDGAAQCVFELQLHLSEVQ